MEGTATYIPRAERFRAINKRHNTFDILICTGIVLVIIAALFFVFILPITVGDDGMAPVFREGDVIFANKMAKYINSPQRGDAILYSRIGLDGAKHILIGRVIGLPGESVQLQGGNVYINGAYLEEVTYVDVPNFYGDMDVMTIPDKSYFVLCDNRTLATFNDASTIVHVNNIEGVVFLRLFPFSNLNFFGVK